MVVAMQSASPSGSPKAAAHEPHVELGDEFVVFAIDLGNEAAVAAVAAVANVPAVPVTDPAVAVDVDLHGLVADAEHRGEFPHAMPARQVQRGLQGLIHGELSRNVAVHRVQHQDVHTGSTPNFPDNQFLTRSTMTGAIVSGWWTNSV